MPAELPVEFTSLSAYKIRGRQCFGINAGYVGDPSEYIGQVITIDGKRYLVINVEKYAVPLPYGRRDFGVMVEPA